MPILTATNTVLSCEILHYYVQYILARLKGFCIVKSPRSHFNIYLFKLYSLNGDMWLKTFLLIYSVASFNKCVATTMASITEYSAVKDKHIDQLRVILRLH